MEEKLEAFNNMLLSNKEIRTSHKFILYLMIHIEGEDDSIVYIPDILERVKEKNYYVTKCISEMIDFGYVKRCRAGEKRQFYGYKSNLIKIDNSNK